MKHYSEDDLTGTSFLGYIHPRERESLRELLGALAAGSAHESQARWQSLHAFAQLSCILSCSWSAATGVQAVMAKESARTAA